MQEENSSFVAFLGNRLLARGSLADVAQAAKACENTGPRKRIAIFDEQSGAPTDLDLSGSSTDVQARFAGSESGELEQPKRRGRGRPRLGVISREVSLLPRHWSWLGRQSGGASAALRRLVDAARRDSASEGQVREAVEATHRFMWDMAGDEPGFEEASRALFANDFTTFEQRIADFPPDVREQLLRFTQRAEAAVRAQTIRDAPTAPQLE